MSGTSWTHLFLGLELALDLITKHRQEDAATQWQTEYFRVDNVFDTDHLPLRQSTTWNFRNNFNDEVTVGEIQHRKNNAIVLPKKKLISHSPQFQRIINFH